MNNYNYLGNNYLPQYGFGDWIKKNASTIGTGIGALGFLGGPALGAATMGLGSSIGASVQGKYETEEAGDAQEFAMQQQQNQMFQQSNLNMAQQRFQNNQQNNRFNNGTQNFAYGGNLDGEKTLEKQNIKPVDLQYLTQSGKQWFPLKPTIDILRDTTNNYFPVGTGNAAQPIYGTYNKDLVDDSIKYKSSIDSNKNIYYPSKTLENLYKNPPTEDYLKSQPKFDFPGFANGGRLNNLMPSFGNGGGLQEYTGQDHSGPQGGIKVDQNGSPVSITGEQPVGLVEKDEVSWSDPETGQEYIFSDRLSL